MRIKLCPTFSDVNSQFSKCDIDNHANNIENMVAIQNKDTCVSVVTL